MTLKVGKADIYMILPVIGCNGLVFQKFILSFAVSQNIEIVQAQFVIIIFI